jgi:hypothetical protein
MEDLSSPSHSQTHTHTHSLCLSSYLNPPVLRLIRSDEDLVDVPTVSILIRKRRRGSLHQIRIRHQVTGVRGHVFIDLREEERKERKEEEGRKEGGGWYET